MYFLGSSRRFSSSFNCPGNQLQHAGVNPITGGNKWLDYLLSPRLPKQRELRDPTSISFNAMQVSSGSFFSSNCAGSCAGSRSTSSTADPLVEGAAGVSEGSSECAKTSPALQVLQRSRPSYLNVLLILRNATLFEMLVNFVWTVPQPILLKLSSPSFFGFFRLFFLLQLRWFMLHFFHCVPSCWRRRRGFRRLLRMCKDITSATSSATVPPIIFECPDNLKECYFEKC